MIQSVATTFPARSVVAGMTLIVLCWLQHCQAVELGLRPQASLTRSTLRVADIAQVSGIDPADAKYWEELVLAPAPAPGRQLFLGRRQVLDLIAARGIETSRVRMAGARQVAVRRSTTTMPAARPSASTRRPNLSATRRKALVNRLERLLLRHLRDTVGDWQGKVELHITTAELEQLSRARGKLEFDGGLPPWEGRQEFLLLYRDADGDTGMTVEATLSLPAKVVVMQRAVARGDVLSRDDVSLQRVSYTARQAGRVLHSIDDVINKEVTRSLRPNQPLLVDQLRPPTLVRRGDNVTVRSAVGGVSVTVRGTAKKDGSRGEWIPVELDEPRRQLLGRIEGPRLLQVLSDQPSAELAGPQR